MSSPPTSSPHSGHATPLGRFSPSRLPLPQYALVGSLNMVVFYSAFNLLLNARMPVLAANAVAFLGTTVGSFLLNKRWVFRDTRSERVFRQYALFVGCTVGSLVLGSLGLWLLLEIFRDHGRWGTNLAAALTAPVTVAWNFLTYRHWIFRSESVAVGD